MDRCEIRRCKRCEERETREKDLNTIRRKLQETWGGTYWRKGQWIVDILKKEPDVLESVLSWIGKDRGGWLDLELTRRRLDSQVSWRDVV